MSSIYRKDVTIVWPSVDKPLRATEFLALVDLIYAEGVSSYIWHSEGKQILALTIVSVGSSSTLSSRAKRLQALLDHEGEVEGAYWQVTAPSPCPL